MAEIGVTLFARGQREVKRALTDVVESEQDIAKAAEQVDRSVDRVNGTFSRLAATAGSVILTKQLADWGVGAAQFSLKLDALESKAETVFGTQGLAQIQAWGEQYASRLGVADRAIAGLAASVGDLLVPMGFSRDAAADMSTDALTLAGALAEWSGGTKTAEEALRALGPALTGEREELKQYGIVIAEADINARLAAQGLGDLTGEARRQAEAQATLELAWQQSADALARWEAGGNPAITAQNELKASAENLRAELGENLAPALTTLTEFAGGALEVFGDLPEPIQNVGLALVGLTAALPAIASVHRAVKDLSAETGGLGNFLGAGPWGLALGTGAVALVGFQFALQHATDEAHNMADAIVEAAGDDVIGQINALRDALEEQPPPPSGWQEFIIGLGVGGGAALGVLNAGTDELSGRLDELRGALLGNDDALLAHIETWSDWHYWVDQGINDLDAVSLATDVWVRANALGIDMQQRGSLATQSFEQRLGGLTRAQDASIGAAIAMDQAAAASARAMEEAAAAADREAAAIRGTITAMQAASSPVFAAAEARDRLAEAQARSVEVEADGTSTQAEIEAAHRDVASAALDLQGAYVTLNEQQEAVDASATGFETTMQLLLATGQISRGEYDLQVAALAELETQADNTAAAFEHLAYVQAGGSVAIAGAEHVPAAVVDQSPAASGASTRSASVATTADGPFRAGTTVNIHSITLAGRTVAESDPDIEELGRRLADLIDRERARR